MHWGEVGEAGGVRIKWVPGPGGCAQRCSSCPKGEGSCCRAHRQETGLDVRFGKSVLPALWRACGRKQGQE